MKILQGNIHDRCGMCQRTAGYIIHSHIDHVLDILSCHITGALRQRSSSDQLDRFLHLIRCHIIQHDNIRTRLARFLNLLQCLHLDLNLVYKGCILFRHPDCLCNTSDRL